MNDDPGNSDEFIDEFCLHQLGDVRLEYSEPRLLSEDSLRNDSVSYNSHSLELCHENNSAAHNAV